MTKKKNGFASSRLPLYYQVESVLREKIISGAYPVGEQLPTESELIEQFSVSRITIRQALSTLSDEGLIERRQGSGTFVSQRKGRKRRLEGVVHVTGSLDELIEMGLETPVKLLEKNQVETDARQAALLQVKPGTPIFMLKRLRLFEGVPHSLIINYLPVEIGEKLSEAELNSGAILQSIENKLGYQLYEARQQIRAELADPYVAELLNVRVGSALLSIERTVYTEAAKPIEFVHTLYCSDKYGFSVYFKRDLMSKK